jgi:hypothetical protein
MPITLNDIIDLTDQPEIDFSLVEAYGCRMGSCMRAEITINRQTEFVIVYNGKRCIVYNWEQSGGNSRMYIKDAWGMRLFLTEEAVAMLHWGEPHYGELTPVAQAVKVAA